MKKVHIPFLEKFSEHTKSFSFVERIVFYFFVALLAISAVLLLGSVNNRLLVETPAKGGKIVEGIVGAPRFANPLLALSDADRDVTSLVYSGLMKASSDGGLETDLAESYEISEDGLVYTFTIRENAQFHDGTKVTADDVVFTIELAQDPSLKSPKRANWEGVAIEKLSENSVRFLLAAPYTPFLENTTIGILPKHLWEKTPPEQMPFSKYNADPVGSGPFFVVGLERNPEDVPERYKLKAFKDYTLGEPYIEELELRFYANEDELVSAFNSGEVDNIHSITPSVARELASDNRRVEILPLPRIFGVFFNQDSASIFTNREVRVALNRATDRDALVNQVLGGFGRPAGGPLPSGIFHTVSAETDKEDLEGARSILEANGWTFNEELGGLVKETSDESYFFGFSISTSNVPELKQTAEILKEQWERIGAVVEINLFDTGNLNNDVIRPREYETLLFGQIIGRDRDPFAFWHSSQRNDPGLNVALYTNITADSLLEKMREVQDENERFKLFADFEAEIDEDVPAVFLYSPDFIYVMDKSLKGLDIGTITTSAERFLNVHKWHINTEKVWDIFAK